VVQRSNENEDDEMKREADSTDHTVMYAYNERFVIRRKGDNNV